MSDWFKGSLLLAATLSAGIAIGIWYGRSHDSGNVQLSSHATPVEAAHEHVMQALQHTLKLDSVQERAITETLHRKQALVDSAWNTMRPHVNAHLRSTHAEIMQLLTPEQREKFARMAAHGHRQGHH